MAIGPILIFDKSTLEALSVDECVWLSQFYRVNVTPMFFVETIADLDKAVAAGRTPESVVARLALKTSAMTADANAHHTSISTANLSGHEIPFRGFPAVAGSRSVSSRGKKGIVFDVPSEERMLVRWQNQDFKDAERVTAREWRASLEGLDLEGVHQAFRPFVEALGKPRDLRDAKRIADRMMNDPAFAEGSLGFALETLGIPWEIWGDVFKRWSGAGKPILRMFAPYAAHCANVDLFFCLAVASDLISKDRPSNQADLAYLYYLPFCMVFTSSDKLHSRTVPLFLREDQYFVEGSEMKADLKALDQHYSALPEEIRREGVMSFAQRPPLEGDFLVARLWDKCMSPSWREIPTRKPPSDREDDEKLIRELEELAKAPGTRESVGVDEADFVMIERRVPVQVGKWRILPPGIEEKEENRCKS